MQSVFIQIKTLVIIVYIKIQDYEETGLYQYNLLCNKHIWPSSLFRITYTLRYFVNIVEQFQRMFVGYVQKGFSDQSCCFYTGVEWEILAASSHCLSKKAFATDSHKGCLYTNLHWFNCYGQLSTEVIKLRHHEIDSLGCWKQSSFIFPYFLTLNYGHHLYSEAVAYNLLPSFIIKPLGILTIIWSKRKNCHIYISQKELLVKQAWNGRYVLPAKYMFNIIL